MLFRSTEVEEVSGGFWPIVWVAGGFAAGLGTAYWLNND